MEQRKSTSSHAGSAAVLILAVILTGASFYSTGAPSRRTGAPGDFTCADSGCHAGNGLNSSTGSIAFVAPSEYAPSTPVNFVLQTQRPGAQAFGFSITARDAFNHAIGSWEIIPGSGTALSENGLDPTHVTHDQAARVFDEHQWNLRWIPPNMDAGVVTFYAATNTANGNGNQLGDFIFTTSHQLSFASGVDVEQFEIPQRIAIQSAFPNPAHESITLSLDSFLAETVSIEFFDMSGRLVKELQRSIRPGSNELMIETRDLSPGAHVYRVVAAGHTASGSILISR